MSTSEERSALIAEDVRTLHRLGYAQELLRRMSGFSNFAISMSIICILAGGITSFPQGLSSVGGASIGLGWPLGCLFALCVALTMAQVASAFPTAGGLYHWASILGGRGWGWATAWFNLIGLITVLAAINVGTYQFCVRALGPRFGLDPASVDPATAAAAQIVGVLLITLTQAAINHRGIRLTTLLTDFSGYLILVVALILTVALFAYAPSLEVRRLVQFSNFSGTGPPDDVVWPSTTSVAWLFCLGLLLPAYTITGYDASAHTAEETIGAARSVPRGIVGSVLVSGLSGWILLAAVVLAIPSMETAVAQGSNSFHWILKSVLPDRLVLVLDIGIAAAQYLCGLATVTSASRMTYAFARDGGVPLSGLARRVSAKYRTPAIAIWTVSCMAVAFTVYTPAYSTITAACVIFLYISYVIPAGLGLIAYRRTWTHMGPWDIGGWYRFLAVVSVLGCLFLVVIGVQPPNDKNLWIVGVSLALTAVIWFAVERRRFQGPPDIREYPRDSRAKVE